MPAPVAMGMLPVQGTVHGTAPVAVEGQIVGDVQPVQAPVEAVPVSAVAVPPHVVSGSVLSGGTGTYNPVAKPEHHP